MRCASGTRSDSTAPPRNSIFWRRSVLARADRQKSERAVLYPAGNLGRDHRRAPVLRHASEPRAPGRSLFGRRRSDDFSARRRKSAIRPSGARRESRTRPSAPEPPDACRPCCSSFIRSRSSPRGWRIWRARPSIAKPRSSRCWPSTPSSRHRLPHRAPFRRGSSRAHQRTDDRRPVRRRRPHRWLVACVTHFEHYRFDRVGPPIVAARRRSGRRWWIYRRAASKGRLPPGLAAPQWARK